MTQSELFFKIRDFASVCSRLEAMITDADDKEAATLTDALKLIKGQAETYISQNGTYTYLDIAHWLYEALNSAGMSEAEYTDWIETICFIKGFFEKNH